MTGSAGFGGALHIVHVRAPVHPGYRLLCWLLNLPRRAIDRFL